VRTTFGLFEQFADAEQAVEALLDEDFGKDEMNVIVQEEIAKNELDLSLEEANIAVTNEVGEKTAQGLEALLGGQQPLTLPEVEEVYAAGEMATILAKTAAAPGTTGEEFPTVLQEFGIPTNIARSYTEGIAEGSLLFWIRTDDGRAAKATDLLRKNNGVHVDDY
jgi:hypothetical protein